MSPETPSEASPDERDAKAPPRRRPIFGALAILFLASGFLGAAFQTSGDERGLHGLGIMVLALLWFAVGSSLAAVAALIGLVRKEPWQRLNLVVFIIGLIPALWLAGVIWYAPPR